MQKVSLLPQLELLVEDYKRQNLKVGFVPTMGFLHSGHLSLIAACKKECDVCIVSIYVNPSQFNEPSDFDSYPKDLKKDCELLQAASCDLVWIPTAEGVQSIPLDLNYELNGVDVALEGKERPGHFKGVIEVVYRLFTAVNPDVAYFGEKDYQQYEVISKMTRNNMLNINIVSVPTIRESDGLAMSSRNVRLSPGDRKLAPELHAVLKYLSTEGDNNIEFAREKLIKKGFKVEYLTPYELSAGGKRLFAAVRLGDVRLIDNVPLINSPSV